MPKPPTIRAYVSAHGFGHATRVMAVLRMLARLEPRTVVQIRSAAPAQLFLCAMPLPLEIAYQVNDIGVIQSDGLTLEGAATLRRYADFLEHRDELLAREAVSLRACEVDLIFGDIPPFASALGPLSGIKTLAMGNFDWDWIYGEWIAEVEGGERIVESIRRDYAATDLLLRLPFHDSMAAFPRQEDVPLVGRRAQASTTETRRRAGIPADAPAVLLSFGGMGLSGADLSALAHDHEHHYVTVGDLHVPRGTHLQEWELQARGILYEDLVAAVDVVVTKPGYGIVSECAVNRTAMLYTERGAFREYPILVEQMRDYFPARYIAPDELRAGRLPEPLRKLRAQPWPDSAPPTNGAEIVARRLLELALSP